MTTLDPRALTRPIIGIENRTVQEVFDIMSDRFRAYLSRPQADEPVLAKRPVAFRVKDFADDWILFHDEEKALAEADATGALMQGLYVRDGSASPQPANPAGANMYRAPVDDDELQEWANLRAGDAGRLARELVGYRFGLVAIGAGGQARSSDRWEAIDEKGNDNFATSIYEAGYKGLLVARCNQNGKYPWQAASIIRGLEANRTALSQPHPADERVVEALELNDIHIRLLQRGATSKWIGLSDDAGTHMAEVAALGQLRRAGLARYCESELPAGPPTMRLHEITDSGRAALSGSGAGGWQEIPITDETVNYVMRYGGRCRDCADAMGVCPTSGLPCVADEARSAICHTLRAVNYGFAHGYLPAAPTGEAK